MKSKRLLSSVAYAAIAVGFAVAPAGAGEDIGAKGDFAPYETLPAVSAPNGKLDASGGWLNDDGRFQATGAWSLPIDHDYGFQLDGLVGVQDNDFSGGVASHLFRRDPERYLLGLYGAYVGVGGGDLLHLGLEGHYYLDRISLEGLAGYEDTNINGVGDGAFAHLTGAFYAQDNLRLEAGYRYVADRDVGVFGFEYLTEFRSFLGAPAAIFGKVKVGSDSFDTGYLGVRFYFGPDPSKSLIRRHREDDPFVNIQELAGIVEDAVQNEGGGGCPSGFIIGDGGGCIPGPGPGGPGGAAD